MHKDCKKPCLVWNISLQLFECVTCKRLFKKNGEFKCVGRVKYSITDE